MAQQIQGAIMAHIAEHLAYNYRANVEKQLGVQLPDPDAEMSPEIEVEVSRLVAQASQQLLQTNQQQAQALQAQQMAQNPELQLKQAEVQIQQGELKRKADKDKADNAIAQQRLQIDAQRVAADFAKEKLRLRNDAHKTIAQNMHGGKLEGNRLASQEKIHGQKIRADVVKHLAQQQAKLVAPTAPVENKE